MYYNMLLYNFINEGENMSEKEIIVNGKNFYCKQIELRILSFFFSEGNELGYTFTEDMPKINFAIKNNCTCVLETKTVDGLRESVEYLRKYL